MKLPSLNSIRLYSSYRWSWSHRHIDLRHRRKATAVRKLHHSHARPSTHGMYFHAHVRRKLLGDRRSARRSYLSELNVWNGCRR
jgi:hypothetical protein